MLPGRAYWLKIGAKTVTATLARPKYRIDVNRLEHLAARRFEANEIGVCNLALDRLVAFISPFRAERRMARAGFDAGEFVEVFVDAPLAMAEARDPKGLYAKARRGELTNFTGIDSPYEPPERPELRIDTTITTPDEAADLVVALLSATDAPGTG